MAPFQQGQFTAFHEIPNLLHLVPDNCVLPLQNFKSGNANPFQKKIFFTAIFLYNLHKIKSPNYGPSIPEENAAVRRSSALKICSTPVLNVTEEKLPSNQIVNFW